MHFSNLNKVVLTASLLATGFSYADSDRPLLSLSVSQSGGTALNSEGSLNTRTPASQSRVLPIWGDEARARGYDLPEPFGVSYNYMNLRQDIIVDKIGFNSSTEFGQDIFSQLLIDVGHTRSSNESHMLKLDTWVFPFMNVYGIYGKTKGTSTAQLKSVGFDVNAPLATDIPFNLDYEGKSYGAGFTLAGGYNQYFATFDLNYTKTNLDILDGDIKALVITPRVGYEFVFEPLIAGQGNTKLQVWTGAMYQDITQRFKGDISKLSLPDEFDDIMNKPWIKPLMGDMKFDVEQHLAHKWNQTVGARLEVTRNFNVITELGFNNRNSFFVSGEFRF
ncbi:hypothetical protein QSH14_12295 [Proteus faecis]|uniref:Lipoprotein n=1 Tax=Proteus faecis TaxID=2050967 RepID=A0AAW7CNI7_9GAMM|nr:hypothetical protein [Proteus faecis]MDL5168067.1 hypothetical protein [Proteus faecis]MDL5276052.1 hypothetical protein [Proteus faecis]MDL5279619.1 hypothetical protein [Proteus faecis]MDL5308568.1 hypothetical protein [Proteus faecis]MDL5312131.1 hypothetical protein [Proteus faecis]